MKLLNDARIRTRQPRPRTATVLPVLGKCRCFLCSHESDILMPLSPDQRNWIECEHCEIDNEIPIGTPFTPVIQGQIPTSFF